MISAVFSAASDEIRSRSLRIGFLGVGGGVGSSGGSVLVELLLVPRLLPSVDVWLLLVLSVVLNPLVAEDGISVVLGYGYVPLWDDGTVK
jgi:hypothetical protein